LPSQLRDAVLSYSDFGVSTVHESDVSREYKIQQYAQVGDEESANVDVQSEKLLRIARAVTTQRDEGRLSGKIPRPTSVHVKTDQ
jgi:hypothetical protein